MSIHLPLIVSSIETQVDVSELIIDVGKQPDWYKINTLIRRGLGAVVV